MNYEVLARRWRPSKFSEVKGQDHVVKAIKGSLRSSTIGHAYLFTGTRGIGKTTLARIFAKAINCKNLSSDFEPCLECSSCKSLSSGNSLDYQEIDGASHNGVENIRSLVETLPYLPTEGKYKVYVIDEVHMLSNSAFNALLKNLEEPPAHVVFIFATTDPEKLLPTVLSRCQRFDLRPMSQLTLTDYLGYVLEKEGIKLENEDVLKSICQAGKGSVRDALTLVEQLRNFSGNNEITEESLLFSLGLTKLSAIKDICRAIYKKDVNEITNIFNECLKENIDIETFAHQILDFYYDQIQEAILGNRDSARMVEIYQTLSDDFKWALSSFNPEKAILISLQKSTLETQTTTAPATPAPKAVEKESASVPVQKEEVSLKREEAKPVLINGFHLQDFLEHLKQTRAASAANLELGNLLNFEVNEGISEVTFGFPEKSRLMYDYFQEKDIFESVHAILGEYLKKETSEVKLRFEILNKEEQKEKSFKSLSDITESKRQKTESEIKQQFVDTDPIKKAQKLFGAKVEDVRVKGSL